MLSNFTVRWCGTFAEQNIQKWNACFELKFVYNDFNTSYTELLARANLPTLQLHRKREILVEVFKSVNKMSPSFMWDLFKVKDITITYEVTEIFALRDMGWTIIPWSPSGTCYRM